MNDVKFRFVNRYDGDNSIRFEYTSINELEGEDSWQGKVNYKRVCINLFTGLKDKNGKEIYENDVVRLSAGHKDHVKDNFEIIFYDGAFCLKKTWLSIEEQKPTSIIYYGDNCIKNGFELSVGNYIEIIGNIYENKELL